MVVVEHSPVKPVAFVKTNASVLLDLIRGLAALAVLGEHWRNIFFVSYPQVSDHRYLIAPLYLLTSAGHQSVVIFFVLSGYLIGGSVFRMIERGSWSWKAYFTHRLVRLWIVLIPGLLLCALWDELGLRSHLAPLLYSGLSPDHLFDNISETHHFPVFFGNLFFLQDIRVRVFGSDGPLWSLANEFWYYVLFPLGLFAVLPQTLLRARLICIVCFAAIAWFLPPDIVFMFPVWLFGVGLALVRPPKLQLWHRILAGVLFVPIFFSLGRLTSIRLIVVEDYLLAVFTTIFLWIVLSASTECRSSTGEWFSRLLSRFSFTLYVVHMPLCVFLAALLLGDRRWQPDLAHLAASVGILLIIIAYALGLASVTEFRTEPVRRWIEARLVFGQKM